MRRYELLGTQRENGGDRQEICYYIAYDNTVGVDIAIFL
jgi:hypothetical protein